MSTITITVDRAIAEFIPSARLYACAYANAETAANAYNDGDHNLAARLWSQSDALIRVANNIKVRELAHSAAA